MAYDLIDPIGDMRGDLHSAIIAAAVMNSQGGINGRAVKPDHFMPTFGPPPPRPTLEEVAAKMDRFFGALPST